MAALHRPDWHHLNIANVWPYANELCAVRTTRRPFFGQRLALFNWSDDALQMKKKAQRLK
jgi:hypothetical protein